ncbi:transposase [Akkermansiaceae bacterium]|nr:transposase [Akkermansiaceae bacterium]
MFYDPKKPVDMTLHRLPHWHQDDTYVFITWRLADSLPEKVVALLKSERDKWLNCQPKPWSLKDQIAFNRRFTLKFEEILDDAHGSCCLRYPAIAQIIADAFLHFHEDRYHLDSFVVMPNHVHLLLKLSPGHPLDKVVQSLKRFTSRDINKALNRDNTLWQSGYWDRLIRSQKHLNWTRQYILDNPKNLSVGYFLLWSVDL